MTECRTPYEQTFRKGASTCGFYLEFKHFAQFSVNWADLSFIVLRELNAMQLSVWKIKSKRCSLGRKTSYCAFVKNLFIDVANVVFTGQNAYAPVTLKIAVLLQKYLLEVNNLKWNKISN